MDVDGRGQHGRGDVPPAADLSARPPASSGSPPSSQRERSGSTTSTNDNITLPRAYINFCAARAASNTVRTLGEGAVVSTQSTVGSFIVMNDTRVLRANHRHCYGKKSNISASFDLEKNGM
jgi:hypothetical protein